MSRSAVETFCRALNELQSRTTSFAKSNKELLLERKEMRSTLLELLPTSSLRNIILLMVTNVTSQTLTLLCFPSVQKTVRPPVYLLLFSRQVDFGGRRSRCST